MSSDVSPKLVRPIVVRFRGDVDSPSRFLTVRPCGVDFPLSSAVPLQLRVKLNQEQGGRLQQQRDNLNKRNLEVAAMDRRLAELRLRLRKKKAALQQKENLPVSVRTPVNCQSM